MPALEQKRLLVVEDEYMLADDLARALRAAGAEVVGPFSTEREALKSIDQGLPLDAAVLDLNLNGERCSAIIERLAEKGIPFVLATGYGPEAIAHRFAEIPRWEKPYDALELAKALPMKLFF